MKQSFQVIFLLVSAGFTSCINSRSRSREGIALASQLQARETSALSDLVQWSYLSSIVIGNFLYLSGGDICFNTSGSTNCAPENNTLTIDLRSSWTNESLVIKEIPQAAPPLNSAALWADISNRTFFQWAGEKSAIPSFSSVPTPSNSLWHFTPDDEGSGSWEEVDVPSNFLRTVDALVTSGNGRGYALGGFVDSEADVGVSDGPDGTSFSSPGLVTYSMNNDSWSNNTASCWQGSCFAVNGGVQYVPYFGDTGILVAYGGISTLLTVNGDYDPSRNIPFTSVGIYDTGKQQWFNQSTIAPSSTEIPTPRGDFCSVGVAGDNGTYEIFIFGGRDNIPGNESSTALDEIYVLSVPAFAWFKVDYDPVQARAHHTCQVAGARQMISIGGFNPVDSVQDVWPQGINIFDLSDLVWKTSYDPNAAPYVTPAVVKAWYASNGAQPPEWSSPEVEALFEKKSTNKTSSASPPPAPHPAKLRGTAIAGIVAGISIAIIALLVVLYCVRRRGRNRNAREKKSTRFNWDRAELLDEGHTQSSQLRYVEPRAELGDRYTRQASIVELGDEKGSSSTRGRAELAGGKSTQLQEKALPKSPRELQICELEGIAAKPHGWR